MTRAWGMRLTCQGLGTLSWYKESQENEVPRDGWDQAFLGFQGSPGGPDAQGGVSILPG